jgi:NitT/TauT family transport system substrate-binding protein
MLTPLSKVLIAFVLVALIGGGIWYLNSNPSVADAIAPGAAKDSPKAVQVHKDVTSTGQSVEKLVVGINTWGGFAGAVYENNGFAASENSKFYKDYGVLIEFKLIDDFNASREAWKSGDIDVLGFVTIDAFTTEVDGLKTFGPKVIGQIDWSRGGDAVVVRRGINTISDLKSKTIACAPMTPSHSLLLWLLSSNDLSWNDVVIKEVANGMDAADLFKKGQVDAAVVWAPDDADCVDQVKGSKVLVSTKMATNIIADVWLVKESNVKAKKNLLKAFVEGYLKGNAEVNSSTQAKHEAAQYLADGFGQKIDFCLTAIENTRLATYGDNLNFFDLSDGFKGVTGEQLYNSSAEKFRGVHLNDGTAVISNTVPSWRTIAEPSFVRGTSLTVAGPNAPEKAFTFSKPTPELAKAEAISTKKLTITFATGSSELDENAKYIVDNGVVGLTKSFGAARVRIEGNTDNVGGADMNKSLSLRRARAVADYLTKEHGFDSNKFVVVGNGPDKPVDTNSTEQGRSKNRRTDFELIGN